MRARRVLAPVLAAALLGPALPAQDRSPVVTSLTLFAGTSTGLWRSRDWGGGWERVTGATSGESLEGLGAVQAILPLGPLVYVAGEGGLFVSADFGQTWHRHPGLPSSMAVLPSRYPQADPTVFVGTTAGLFKSADGGATFKPTALGGTPVYRIDWPGPALLVATGRGVLASPDGGATFSGPGTGLPEGRVRALALSSFFAMDPVLYAGLEGGGVHRSADGGRSWTPAGLADHSVTDLVWLGPILYAVTQRGPRRSDDLGRTWRPLGRFPPERVPARLMLPLAPESGAEVFLATDSGVYRSVDGGESWQSAGLLGENVLCVATFPPPERAARKRKPSRRIGSEGAR